MLAENRFHAAGRNRMACVRVAAFMTWVRVRVRQLRDRAISPAVPAAIRTDPGWARAYVSRPTSAAGPREDTLEPERWLRPAFEKKPG